MSLGCAGASCGDCCDPVGLDGRVITLIEEWRAWLEAGGTPETAIEGGADPSIFFAIDHWTRYEGPALTEEEHHDFRCDRYDPTTHLCTAYEDRPPVCRNFPWYTEEESAGARAARLPARCSFNLDIPPALRKPGARPLIPIMVVTR